MNPARALSPERSKSPFIQLPKEFESMSSVGRIGGLAIRRIMDEARKIFTTEGKPCDDATEQAKLKNDSNTALIQIGKKIFACKKKEIIEKHGIELEKLKEKTKQLNSEETQCYSYLFGMIMAMIKKEEKNQFADGNTQMSEVSKGLCLIENLKQVPSADPKKHVPHPVTGSKILLRLIYETLGHVKKEYPDTFKEKNFWKLL